MELSLNKFHAISANMGQIYTSVQKKLITLVIANKIVSLIVFNQPIGINCYKNKVQFQLFCTFWPELKNSALELKFVPNKSKSL